MDKVKVLKNVKRLRLMSNIIGIGGIVIAAVLLYYCFFAVSPLACFFYAAATFLSCAFTYIILIVFADIAEMLSEKSL